MEPRRKGTSSLLLMKKIKTCQSLRSCSMCMCIERDKKIPSHTYITLTSLNVKLQQSGSSKFYKFVLQEQIIQIRDVVFRAVRLAEMSDFGRDLEPKSDMKFWWQTADF